MKMMMTMLLLLLLFVALLDMGVQRSDDTGLKGSFAEGGVLAFARSSQGMELMIC